MNIQYTCHILTLLPTMNNLVLRKHFCTDTGRCLQCTIITGHKIDKVAHKPGKKKNRKESRDNQGFPQELMQSRQHAGEADPGVISDSDDEGFGVCNPC